mmetsp:Transcript_30165/g.98595  ORF Transcript_30165/g.98595 Transcript_30165/m.98595 type:complete len:273 (-) Transcript_30165:69-887(-)
MRSRALSIAGRFRRRSSLRRSRRRRCRCTCESASCAMPAPAPSCSAASTPTARPLLMRKRTEPSALTSVDCAAVPPEMVALDPLKRVVELNQLGPLRKKDGTNERPDGVRDGVEAGTAAAAASRPRELLLPVEGRATRTGWGATAPTESRAGACTCVERSACFSSELEASVGTDEDVLALRRAPDESVSAAPSSPPHVNSSHSSHPDRSRCACCSSSTSACSPMPMVVISCEPRRRSIRNEPRDRAIPVAASTGAEVTASVTLVPAAGGRGA